MNKKPLCGIDEAGRGPLAGSLVIAGVVLKNPVEGLMDSKKLTEKKREALYPLVIENAEYHIVSFSAQEVDEIGISHCLQQGLQSIQKHLPEVEYLFDGNPSFQVDKGDFYREILEQARIISKRPNGYGLGALHPRIQCIDDITRRITFEAFEWRLLEHHIVSGLGELPLHDEVLVPSALN